jgi:hypothetical protein
MYRVARLQNHFPAKRIKQKHLESYEGCNKKVKSCKQAEEGKIMKKWSIGLMAIALIIFCFHSPSLAGDTKPINLSLFDPVQIFDADTSIKGFRLNLIYGVNQDMTGLDIGLANHAKGNMSGVQLGLANIVGSDFKGWQTSLANVVYGSGAGLQIGVYNYGESFRGMQLAAVNHTKKFSGLAIGAVNYTDVLNGLQIGVLNFNWRGEPLKFFPVLNFSF